MGPASCRMWQSKGPLAQAPGTCLLGTQAPHLEVGEIIAVDGVRGPVSELDTSEQWRERGEPEKLLGSLTSPWSPQVQCLSPLGPDEPIALRTPNTACFDF